jgi:transposase
MIGEEDGLLLFVGDDWAEESHDVELQDGDGRVLARAKLSADLAGMTRLHALVGEHVGDAEDVTVVVGIETDRGVWVQALAAAGYELYALNPLKVARFRERYRLSGAKADPSDAHVLADMVRIDRHQLRPTAGDSPTADAVRVVTRAHKTLIWERTRHLLRLRQVLLDFFPAALDAYEDLTAPDTLELLTLAPNPASAAALTVEQVVAVLARARRHRRKARAEKILAALRTPQLGLPPVVAEAYGATVRVQAAILSTLNTQIAALEGQVEAHFGRHPDAEIYLSQPGLGTLLGARVLAEFGDDPRRFADAKARKNYAGTSPVTRRSGKKRVVLARFVHNDRLIDALGQQAFSALTASPGARAYYDILRGRGVGHRAALRQLGNRLVGILHGCLKTRTLYDETKAWHHPQEDLAAAA